MVSGDVVRVEAVQPGISDSMYHFSSSGSSSSSRSSSKTAKTVSGSVADINGPKNVGTNYENTNFRCFESRL